MWKVSPWVCYVQKQSCLRYVASDFIALLMRVTSTCGSPFIHSHTHTHEYMRAHAHTSLSSLSAGIYFHLHVYSCFFGLFRLFADCPSCSFHHSNQSSFLSFFYSTLFFLSCCVLWKLGVNKDLTDWLTDCVISALYATQEGSWETLCFACHFTPLPFLEYTKTSNCPFSCIYASSVRGSEQVEKAEVGLRSQCYFLHVFCKIIKKVQGKTAYTVILKWPCRWQHWCSKS